MNKREKDRIEKAFSWIQRKLKTNYILLFEQFDASKDPDVCNETALAVERTNRDAQDKVCFVVSFDPKNSKRLSFNDLKSYAYHEMLHMMTWNKRDAFEETLKHVKGLRLKNVLRRLFYDADESATYAIERASGPFIIARWNSDRLLKD